MPRRNFYQAVIFNIYGLFPEAERITYDAWKRAGGGLGYPMPEAVVRTIAFTLPVDAEKFLKKLFGSDIPFDKIYSRMVACRDAYIEHWSLSVTRGVRSVLGALRAMQIPKALASWSDQKSTQLLLEKSDLFRYFDVVVSQNDLSFDDGLKEMYMLAAGRLGVPNERCIVVEKTDSGICSAHEAGMTVVMLADSAHKADAAHYVYSFNRTLPGVAREFIPLLETKHSTSVATRSTFQTQ